MADVLLVQRPRQPDLPPLSHLLLARRLVGVIRSLQTNNPDDFDRETGTLWASRTITPQRIVFGAKLRDFATAVTESNRLPMGTETRVDARRSRVMAMHDGAKVAKGHYDARLLEVNYGPHPCLLRRDSRNRLVHPRARKERTVWVTYLVDELGIPATFSPLGFVSLVHPTASLTGRRCATFRELTCAWQLPRRILGRFLGR